MNLSVSNTITIDEDALIDYLHKLHPAFSVDENMDWLATSEGDSTLLQWISDNAAEEFEYLDDYSYEELIDYIENNF